MKKTIFICLFLVGALAYGAVGKLQNADFMTAAQITGAGGTISQLLNTSKIYDSTNAQLLDTTIAGKANSAITISTTAPLTGGGNLTANRTLSMPQASGSQDGYLSSTDWTTFNNKGSGTVTAVSVATANGLAGSSSGGATPALTLSTTITGVLKGNGTAISAAVSGTDYAPATSGTSILKGDGSGGFANAVSSTDYAPATSGSAILKGNGTGGFSSAVSGTDYAPATTGTAILKANGSGGFSAAVAGTDYEVPLTFSTGLTRSVNTVTVNTSQNISTLSNLTTNGYVKTSGGTGALSVQAVPIPVADGGTGQTTYTDGQLLIGNTTGNTLTKSTLTAGSGITITNGAGSITIAASGGSSGIKIWDGFLDFTDGSCATNSGTYADFGSCSSLSLTENNNSGMGTVTAAGSSLPGIQFTCPSAGYYEISVEGSYTNSGSNTQSIRLLGASTVISATVYDTIPATSARRNFATKGFYNCTNTSTNTTFKIQGANNGGTTSLNNAATNFTGGRALHWTVIGPF